MQADPKIKKLPGDRTFAKEHAAFHEKLHDDAIEYTRAKLKEYAEVTKARTTDFNLLHDDIQDKMNALASLDPKVDQGWDDYCRKTKRADWPDPVPDP